MLTTFVPRVTFIGYPVDDRIPVTFTKGQESIPVPEAFAQLMRDKGLVADRRDPLPVAKTRPRRRALEAPAPAVAKKIATAVKKPRRRRRSPPRTDIAD